MMLLEPNQVQGTVKSNIVNMKININKQKKGRDDDAVRAEPGAGNG